MNAHPNLTFHSIISVIAPSPNHGHIRRYWREEFFNTGLGGGDVWQNSTHNSPYVHGFTPASHTSFQGQLEGIFSITLFSTLHLEATFYSLRCLHCGRESPFDL